MILFFLLCLLIFVWTMIDNTISKKYVLLSSIIPIFIFAIWGIDFSSGNIPFFISDENHYLSMGISGFPEFSDRFLWYLVNYWVYHNDLFLGGLPLKLVNIPFYVGFLILLSKLFETNKVYLLSMALPYTAYVATFNLRDITILFFITLTIYLYYKKKSIWLISLFFLYLLRPFSAMLVGILIFIFDFIKIVKQKKLSSIFTRFVLFAVVLRLFGNTVLNRFYSYQAWFEYTTGEGYEEHTANQAGGFASGNLFVDFMNSLIRYVVTPAPLSLLKRMLQGGSETWGVVDDGIRFLHQIGYVLIVFLILINVKYFKKTLKYLKEKQFALLLILLSYWPIYSFHLYGGTHQRLKIPFQIMLFLILLLLYKTKKMERKNNEENLNAN